MEWLGAVGVIAGILFGFSQWLRARRSPTRQARGELVGNYTQIDHVHRLVISTPGDKPIEFEAVESIDDFIQLFLNGKPIKQTYGPRNVDVSQRPFAVAPGRPVVLDWIDVNAQPTVISVGLRKVNGDVVDVAVLEGSAG